MTEELLKHNREWAAERVMQDPNYFKRLQDLQTPKYLWIGCSDSRVPANVITGLEPGEVFVHRNVANLVHPSDINLLSVLEYAVEQLKVEHIIVCGHYGCGGVKAAIDGNRYGVIDHWLQPIRDTAETHHAQLDSIEDQPSKLDKLCELSIAHQVARLANTPIIKDARKNGAKLKIHGWVYGLSNGLIQDLDCGC